MAAPAKNGGPANSTAVKAKRRPKGHTSVMASRQKTAPDALDFYPTPPWAARAGGELIAALDPLEGMTCAEPAAGGGHMAHGLKDVFRYVIASDIFEHGGPVPAIPADFLATDWPDRIGGAESEGDAIDWIVTNPPFKAAEAFARLGWQRARRGVALLCRLSFLETVDRYALLYGNHPLSVVAPFAERVPMQKDSWDPGLSTATAYAWFVWLAPSALAACPFRHAIEAARAVGGALCLPIAPGAKQRLHRREDVQLFCEPAAAPLLEGL